MAISVTPCDADAKLPIRILCRTDLDWGALAERRAAPSGDDALRHLPTPKAADPTLVSFLKSLNTREILDLWDDVFAVDFFAFRHALQQISIENLHAVCGAAVSVGIASMADWYDSDSDEMIFPIDDDDYFDPGLVASAPLVDDDETVLVLWPHAQYRYDDETGAPSIETLPLATLLSNNWGVRKSFLKQRFTEEEARRVLADHVAAANRIADVLGADRPSRRGGWMAVDLRVPSVRFTSETHGLSLKHVGSLLTLHRALKTKDRTSLTRPRLGEAADVPAAVAWAEPWVRRAEAAFSALAANVADDHQPG